MEIQISRDGGHTWEQSLSIAGGSINNKDLCIGNVLYDETNDNYVTVTEVNAKGLKGYHYRLGAAVLNFPWNIIPLKMSEPILGSVGFQPVANDRYVLDKLKVEVSGDNIIYSIDTDKGSICFQLTYLHQIQTFYRVITGSELLVKLYKTPRGTLNHNRRDH